MRNILYINDTGKIIGGGEISLINLISTLDRKKYNPILLTGSDGTLNEKIKSEGAATLTIPWKSFKNLLNLRQNILNYQKIKNIIKYKNINIIHCNTCGGLTILSALAAKKMNIPFIWHVRSNDRGGIIDLLSARLSTAIICISSSVLKRFRPYGIENKLIKVHNGVCVSSFENVNTSTFDLRNEIGCPRSAFLITAIGRFHPVKGYKYLIKAAKIVLSTSSNCFFLIVGMSPNEQKKYLKKLEILAKKLGISKKIKFLHARSDVPEILTQSDIFALSSPNEPFGRSLIEAMACRKPVIAVGKGGPKEIINDNVTGLLAKPRDHISLAEKINALIANPDLRRSLGDNAHDEAVKNFSIEKHTHTIESIYANIIRQDDCIHCKKNNFDIIEASTEYCITKCRNCRLVSVNPIPKQAALEKHYDESYYKEWITTESKKREEMWQRRLKKLEGMCRPGKLLDIGAGPGIFLNIAKNNGWDVYGTEISKFSCDYAKQHFDIEILHAGIAQAGFPDDHFDAITMWHVLEHTENPQEVLREVYRILKPSGTLIIAVPNIHCYAYNTVYKLVKFNKPRIFFPQGHEIHLYHFSEKTLKQCVSAAGLKTIKTSMDTERILWKEQAVESIARLFYSLTRVNIGLAIELYATKKVEKK